MEAPTISVDRARAVVFSKDRPLQLDGALGSMRWSCRDPDALEVAVLFAASDARQRGLYRAVAADHPWATFVEERGFRDTLLGATEGARALLFVVDDALFVRPWSIRAALSALARHPEALGFSLRLGRNTTHCYMLDRPQRPPPMLPIEDGALAFDWTSAEGDFGYPLELSSSLYRGEDLHPLLRALAYVNPNDLEDQLARRARDLAPRRPVLLCHEQSVAFCAPVNVVQKFCPNRSGSRPEYTPEALTRAFEAGRRIRVEALRGHVPTGCHEEIDLPLTETGACETGRAPVVSVVIRCYEQAHFLPMAVASVVLQTFGDWEIVVVDDGSPDDTARVARDLADRVGAHRLRLVRQANGGLSAALNAGVRAARGRYILPLDADDFIEASHLRKTVAILDSDASLSIVYTDGVEFGGGNRLLQCRPTFDLSLCQGNGLNYCALYRREVWEAVGGYNTNMVYGYEDWDFWIGCAEREFQARHLPEPLFFYRVKSESAFTRARRHDAQLRARIVMNHPRLYTSDTVARAQALLDASPLPSASSRPAGADPRAAAPPDDRSGGQPGAEVAPAALAPAAPSPACTVQALAGPHPRVSVVIPCYRQAQFLAESMSSVALQTFQDWEIIVVDDGSPDDTAEVFGRIARGLPDRSLRLIRQQNQGVAAARNAGIAAARGRYALPLDADDLLDPSFLENTVAALASHPDASIAFSDVFAFGQEREVRRMGPWDLHALCATNRVCSTALFDVEVWRRAGGYDTAMRLGYEDWDFWITCAELGFRAVHVQEPLFYYRLKPGSRNAIAMSNDALLRAQVASKHPRSFQLAGTRRSIPALDQGA